MSFKALFSPGFSSLAIFIPQAVKTMDTEADKNTEDAPEVVPAGGVEL